MFIYLHLYVIHIIKERGEKMKADRKKLEMAMARACMTTDQLQVASQMPRPTLNNVIVGKNVRPATLGTVAKALGVDVTEIIED